MTTYSIAPTTEWIEGPGGLTRQAAGRDHRRPRGKSDVSSRSTVRSHAAGFGRSSPIDSKTPSPSSIATSITTTVSMSTVGVHLLVDLHLVVDRPPFVDLRAQQIGELLADVVVDACRGSTFHQQGPHCRTRPVGAPLPADVAAEVVRLTPGPFELDRDAIGDRCDQQVGLVPEVTVDGATREVRLPREVADRDRAVPLLDEELGCRSYERLASRPTAIAGSAFGSGTLAYSGHDCGLHRRTIMRRG